MYLLKRFYYFYFYVYYKYRIHGERIFEITTYSKSPCAIFYEANVSAKSAMIALSIFHRLKSTNNSINPFLFTLHSLVV